MFRGNAPTPIMAQPSPLILKHSPDAQDGRDISFEAYKQPKPASRRKRSFSPIVHEQFMISPDISPIALKSEMRMSPRTNTPGTKNTNMSAKAARQIFKQPAILNTHDRRKAVYILRTPLSKRQLEHRITVSNILKDINLSKYISIFNDEEIDFEVFLTLSETDLHDIGIQCQKDIELILAKVAEYNASA
ncbi:ankyrin repeat and SAM domain-containing protein 6-like [Toxorhynchites rutilus septentrionalis]|uniref:ankyrin repeat and SAM domain-containing protein 6-like n=1 Tax=Toxorhynchites rutilus septentrionalis TaxID=329112 RepID=UPI00247A5DB3|nr:ankyrin repeat and SAM domain-containing protein 6-like [Toxorhynchites rutilus septentrionalis]